eukprot:m.79214 g.79214  ORF g.79214 m.79214 type:complete len:166 (-) comp13274_c0_seq1:31-528(-)
MVALVLLFALLGSVASTMPPYIVYTGKLQPTQRSIERHMFVEGRVVVIFDTAGPQAVVRVQFKNALPKAEYDFRLHVDQCSNTLSAPYIHRHTGETPQSVAIKIETTSRGMAAGGTSVPFLWPKGTYSFVVNDYQGQRIACADITKVFTQSKIKEFVDRIIGSSE